MWGKIRAMEEETIQKILDSLSSMNQNIEQIEKSLAPKRPISTIRSSSDSLATLFGSLETIQNNIDAFSSNSESTRNKKKIANSLAEILTNKITTLCQKVIVLTKAAAEEKKNEGNNFFKAGSYEEAIRSYEEAISIDGDNAIYFSNKALCLHKLERIDEAIEAAKKAISLDVDMIKAYVTVMKCQLKNNLVEEAANICENIPISHQEKSEVLELKRSIAAAAKDAGNIQFKGANLDSAIRLYSISVRLDGSNCVYYSNRSACYQNKKMWKEAAADAAQSVKLNPQFSKGYLHLARSQVQLKLWEEAAQTLRRAQNELRPTGELASIQAQVDSINKEIQDGRAVSSARPSFVPPSASELSRAEAFKTRGNTLYKSGEYQDAIRAYSQAIAACPTEGTFYGNRAAAWMMLKEYKRAQSDCQEGLRLERSPGELDKLRLRQASALTNQGKVNEAIDLLNSVIGPSEGKEDEFEGEARSAESLTPFHQQLQVISTAQANLAQSRVSLENKEYSRALRLVQMAIEAGLDQHVGARVIFSKANIGLGNLEEGSKEAQKAISASGGSGAECIEAYSARGDALKGLGITEQACKHYAAALQLDPDNQEIVRKLKTLRRLISETTRIREEITTAMNHSHFELAASLASDGLQVDRESKSLMGEMHFKRGKAYFQHAKSLSRHPKWGDREGSADPVAFYRKALTDANSVLYYEKENIEAVFLKTDALEALQRFQESVDELTQTLKQLDEGAEEIRKVKERLKQAQLALKKSKRVDYYSMLGLEASPRLTEDDINRAYRKLALKYHPDRFSGKSEEEKAQATLKFKELGDAKDLLIDPVKRRYYDQGYEREEAEQMAEGEKQQGGRGGHGFSGRGFY